ncbi:uncharacterized protein DUF4232 [Prauserella shujinwangii]|uniref:Uncharacterized protein DUF4232 n=1 Tax=Prauserella shujinwangii TaxID=1453103 RepID=A0A2T0LVQ9_9PSEU|nr:DUF4232 domain-containing protein [Prauserella shujinwangii]PRX47898.1 uncharacterized protein DUF4232 [Prauserella shujinwangii]
MTVTTTVRGRTPYAALAAAGAVLTLALAGCGQGTQNQQADEAAATSAPTTTSTSAAAPATTTADRATGSTPVGGGQPALCQTTQLDITLGQGDGGGAAGTYYKPLRFTNSGEGPCRIQGYPGVSYVAGDDGHQVGPAARRVGEDGPTLTLRPGQTAHAVVGFVQVRNYDPAECRPTQVRGLRVYPPQETEAAFVEAPGTGCASADIPGDQLTVRTVRSGAGG